MSRMEERAIADLQQENKQLRQVLLAGQSAITQLTELYDTVTEGPDYALKELITNDPIYSALIFRSAIIARNSTLPEGTDPLDSLQALIEVSKEAQGQESTPDSADLSVIEGGKD